MKFEELEKLWKTQKEEEKILIDKLGILRSYQDPIAKIKHNMTQEFWANIISMVVILFCIIRYKVITHIGSAELVSLLALTLLPTGYYYWKFYKFYQTFFIRGISTYNMMLRFSKRLTEAIADYRIYNIITIIIVCIFLFGFLKYKQFFSYISISNEYVAYTITLLLSFMIPYIICELILYFSYYRYLKKINWIITQLDEDETADELLQLDTTKE